MGTIFMNIQNTRKYHLDRYYYIKSKAIEYLGGKCAICGLTDDLEFDHVNPDVKTFTITDKMFIPFDALLLELDKCQLLCSTHHKEKHSTQHGSLRMYTNYKCRCDLCRINWNEHSAEYRRQRRSRSTTYSRVV